ncbi:MAG: hypothetical protein H0T62_07520 [Parachlamydiaceae bacterium]|nr:hypothetical protein [Parachlamydiaceae bacterium]
MKIIVDDVHFNITSQDLETAQEEFTFWRGRRINVICKTDQKSYPFRFNDLARGILADNAIFEEDDDKQQIYKALNNLKDQGYPYKGSLEIRIMLWFKQFLGNFSRQTLLDQLASKFCEENEESFSEESSSQELISPLYSSAYKDLIKKSKFQEEPDEPSSSENPDTQTIIFPICDPIFKDLLPTLFKYTGRVSSFPLMSTCKLFHDIITNDNYLKNYLRDFLLLKQSFKLSKLKPSPERIRNEIFLLLGEFNIKEVVKRGKPLKKSTLLLTLDPEKSPYLAPLDHKERKIISAGLKKFNKNVSFQHKECQLNYAIKLAKINPEGALRIVTSLLTPEMEFQLQVKAFCAVAAIHKNSTLCDKKKVIEMGTQIYNIRQGTTGVGEHLLAFFEASLDLDNDLAIKILSEIRDSFRPRNIETIVRMLKKLSPFEAEIQKEVVLLLNKTLDAVGPGYWGRTSNLSAIARAFALFDQKRALGVVEQALDFKDSDFFDCYLNDVDGFGDFAITFHFPLIKILAAIDKESALSALLRYFDLTRIVDERMGFRDSSGFRGYYGIFFMGTLDIFVALDQPKACETVKLSVEWAKESRQSDYDLLKLSKALSKSFLEESLEIADLIEEPTPKCEALCFLVSQGLDQQIAFKTVKLGVEWAKNNKLCDRDLLKLNETLSKFFPEEALEIAELIEDPAYKCNALYFIARSRE